ncbi:hypothetical protein BS17DRAFT_728984, partial [Gyrodon lividus]
GGCSEININLQFFVTSPVIAREPQHVQGFEAIKLHLSVHSNNPFSSFCRSSTLTNVAQCLLVFLLFYFSFSLSLEQQIAALDPSSARCRRI